jgi:excisionase family DNA binding protein
MKEMSYPAGRPQRPATRLRRTTPARASQPGGSGSGSSGGAASDQPGHGIASGGAGRSRREQQSTPPRRRDEQSTTALFVRIPTEHARRLDLASIELDAPKQRLISVLVERYVNPASPGSLVALGALTRPHGSVIDPSQWLDPPGALHDHLRPAPAGGSTQDTQRRAPHAGPGSEQADRRRVTVETLDAGELTLGHHSFQPALAPEVLTAEQAAELLQVEATVVLDLARAGRLPGRELSGHWRFARVALLQWLAAGDALDAAGERTHDAASAAGAARADAAGERERG